MAAFLFAFFPLFVEHSYFATPDVPLTLALMLVVLACMRYLESRSLGDLLCASAGASLAVSIKYPGAIAALMVGVVVVVGAARTRQWHAIVTHGGLAALAVVGFPFAISPVLFTNAPEVIRAGLWPGNRAIRIWAPTDCWTGNLWFYASSFALSAGIIAVIAAVAGVYWCVRMRLISRSR